jgi:triphosphoribosyl-dephospho-CoA synthase
VSNVAQAFIEACRAEIEAPKPGNVHIFAGGHDMEARDFLLSAEVSAPFIADRRYPTGTRIVNAVDASMAAVGTNTNLGIILLCFPLAISFEKCLGNYKGMWQFRSAVEASLNELDVADSIAVFRAIRRANPGGMGKVEAEDLSEEPQLPLRAIMTSAMERDRIARAYAEGYADLFETGLPALSNARRESRDAWWPATAVYLAYLTAFPDTHVIRKWGMDAAHWVHTEARAIAGSLRPGPERLTRLLSLDREIKARGLNPGTSADLTVATLFCESLLSILQRSTESG